MFKTRELIQFRTVLSRGLAGASSWVRWPEPVIPAAPGRGRMENRMSKVILGYTTDSKPNELYKTFSQIKEKNGSGPQA